MTQEQIVDNIIMDELDVKHPGSKELILSKTTKGTRRLAVLSILDDNRRLFEQFKNIIRSEEYCSQYAEETVQVLRKYVQVADTEVKEHGEVMTPITLVEEMLDKLPSEVWSNPSLKWLDPCNGVGTFPSIVVKRLMIGLKDVIVDDCERYRHIIENMIYVCEIQTKNMFLYHTAFDREDDYELNTYYGSFLDKEFNKHMKNVWGFNEFDIIIGNPPYNKPGTTNSGNTIWPKFVEKSLELLKNGGFLTFVHPSSWRKPENKLYNQMVNYKIIHLDIHNVKDGLRVFGMGTRYDWYVLHKIQTDNIINLVDEDKQIHLINLSELPFIPNKMINEIKGLLSKKNTLNIIYDRSSYPSEYIDTDKGRNWITKTLRENFIYPVVNNLTNDGLGLIYSSTNSNGHFGVSKVIISASTGKPFLDYQGEYGMGRDIFGISVESEKEGFLITKAIESKKFKEILQSIKWGNFRVEYKFFKHLNKDFYKQFVDENGNEI